MRIGIIYYLIPTKNHIFNLAGHFNHKRRLSQEIKKTEPHPHGIGSAKASVLYEKEA
jgi:hypothetical protein